VTGRLAAEELSKGKEKGFKYYITHLQTDEINQCHDSEKRAKLFLFLNAVQPSIIPTESFILGLSRLNYAKLGGGFIEKLRNHSKDLRKTKDALIAETAILKKLILVTEDKRLAKKVARFGGHSWNIEKFKKALV